MADKFKPQLQYEERQKNKGRVRVAVWVPAASCFALKEYAKSLRRAPGLAKTAVKLRRRPSLSNT